MVKHFIPRKNFLVLLLALFTIACGGSMEDASKRKEPPRDAVRKSKLEQNLKQLTQGLLAYKIPVSMKVGQTYQGIVSITRSSNDSILFDGLEAESGDFIARDIQISSIAKVRLVDPASPKNFEITPINTEEQYVDSASNTVWKWNIRPIRGGENRLYLVATAKILSPVEGYKDITVFDKEIAVKSNLMVTVGLFIAQNWQWLISVIIIPLLGWLINRYSSRRKKSKTG